MSYIYVDDSVHDVAGFVLAAFVYSKTDVNVDIISVFQDEGLDPNVFEYKSGLSVSQNAGLIKIRSRLISLISSGCKIGIAVVPRGKRKYLGEECIKALIQFLNYNAELNDKVEVQIDQGFFKSGESAREIIASYDLGYLVIKPELDSMIHRGLQLADIVAHTYSIQLKEKLGHTIKLVKAGPKSGYPEDLEINLGFELWARFRNHMFRSISPIGLNNLDEEQTFAVEPYGLYISEYCDSKLVGIVRDAFGTVYMGCIH